MRNVKIDEFDRLDRDVVALGNDYAQGFILPPHQHRRAQLLYGATGLMYVTTQDGEWVVPPQHAVWIPPETVHAVRFAGVTTRSLYIEPDCVAAFIKHRRFDVFRGWSDRAIACLLSPLKVVGDNDCTLFRFASASNGVSSRKELAISTKDSTRSGNSAASCRAIYPPIEKPIKENFSGRRVIKCCTTS